MRIVNTGSSPYVLSYRTGDSFYLEANGGYVIRPAGDLDYLDDSAAMLALFTSGRLVLQNDDGSAYTGSPLPAAPNAPPQLLPVLANSKTGALTTGVGTSISTGGGAPVDLVIFAGQSQANSNGTTGADVPAGPLQAAMPNAQIWDPWKNEWVAYQAGVTSAIHTQSGKYANNALYWGFEAEYARRYIANNPGKTLYIVKLAYSSTSIDQAARTAQRGCWDPALRVELYDFLTRAINAARSNLRLAGKTINLRGFHWIQGENEGGVQTAANNYQTTLTNFFTAVRRDADMQSVPFIVSRINAIANWAYGAAVRTAQVTIGDGTPNVRWVNCDDLTRAADGIHYNPTGVIEGGKRHYLASISPDEAYALYTAKLAFTPNAAQKAAIYALIQGLIERSLFPCLEVLQLYCMPDQASALVNVIPYDITAVNSGMTFTAKSGFTGTSANSFLNTGIASGNSSIMQQNDEAVSVWVGNNITVASGVDLGAFAGSTATTVLTVQPSVSSNFRVNHTAVTTDNTFTPGSDVSGLWSMQRDGSPSSAVRQNGSTLKTDAVNASAAPPTSPIFVGNRSLSTTSGTAGTTGRLYQAFAAGSSRTLAQEQALYSLLSTFITTFTVA